MPFISIECPKCKNLKVSEIKNNIWECLNCGHRFSYEPIKHNKIDHDISNIPLIYTCIRCGAEFSIVSKGRYKCICGEYICPDCYTQSKLCDNCEKKQKDAELKNTYAQKRALEYWNWSNKLFWAVSAIIVYHVIILLLFLSDFNEPVYIFFKKIGQFELLYIIKIINYFLNTNLNLPNKQPIIYYICGLFTIFIIILSIKFILHKFLFYHPIIRSLSKFFCSDNSSGISKIFEYFLFSMICLYAAVFLLIEPVFFFQFQRDVFVEYFNKILNIFASI